MNSAQNPLEGLRRKKMSVPKWSVHLMYWSTLDASMMLVEGHAFIVLILGTGITDEKLFRPCTVEKLPPSKPELSFEYLPCQKKLHLLPEDQISLDSIFSGLLDRIEKPEKEYEGLRFNVPAKALHNEKQYLLFGEKLFISKLKHAACKFDEPKKIFLERELEQIGEFRFNVEESFDGYVVFSKSYIVKDKSENRAGHSLRGKYSDRFLLICEKRMEYDYVDNVRVEKTLDAHNQEDKKLVVLRETKVSGDTQRFKADINIYGRTEIFLCDGGIMLFMRYLVMNHFEGERTYFTMNLFGKVLHCVLTIEEQKKQVRLFNRNYENVICITNVKYFNNEPQETTESFYTRDGRLLLHYWHGFNYLLHAAKPPQKPQEKIIPKLELMWKCDNLLSKKYLLEKTLNYESAMAYLTAHPEMVDFLHDYVTTLLKYKPRNVLEFTIRYFQNMRTTF